MKALPNHSKVTKKNKRTKIQIKTITIQAEQRNAIKMQLKQHRTKKKEQIKHTRVASTSGSPEAFPDTPPFLHKETA